MMQISKNANDIHNNYVMIIVIQNLVSYVMQLSMRCYDGLLIVCDFSLATNTFSFLTIRIQVKNVFMS